MRNILAILAGIGLLLAAFAGVALALVLGIMAASAITVARLTGRFRPVMAKASVAQPHDRSKAEYRVWNDGRGTIIDM